MKIVKHVRLLLKYMVALCKVTERGTIPRTKTYTLTGLGDINLLPTCSLKPYNLMSLVWKEILQAEEREM